MTCVHVTSESCGVRAAVSDIAPPFHANVSRPAGWPTRPFSRYSEAMTDSPQLARAAAFCSRYGMQAPVLLAPMAGACPVSLSVAVAKAGGMGAMGALITPSEGIREWVHAFMSQAVGPFQINLWIPDPPPRRDPQAEARMRAFLERWGPPPPETSGDLVLQDFD